MSFPIALICLISTIRRTNVKWVVWANGIYSVFAVIATPIKMVFFPLGSIYIFNEILGFVVFLFLANILYTLYRIFRRD